MWAIRALSGPQSGQIFPLKMGKNLIGRSPHCEIKLAANGVSKEHAQILVTADKMILSDLNSRNGTLINGVRIQNHRLASDDKIMISDVFFDLLEVHESAILPRVSMQGQRINQNTGPSVPSWSAAAPQLQQSWNASMGTNPELVSVPIDQDLHSETAKPTSLADIFGTLTANLTYYIDSVALPGVFKVAQALDFRWVLGLFVGVYIFLVTLLATIPMNSLIRNGIEAESQRRALTIARSLAQSNRQAIIDNMEVAVSTRSAELEDGISLAVIVSAKDGHIIAPANLRDRNVDRPFFREARHETKEMYKLLGGSLVGASCPITFFDTQQGQQIAAHAIVIYDMALVGMNIDHTLSLFLETVAIAFILGCGLFFVLVRLVENPIEDLNRQLDSALREGRDDLSTPYIFPKLREFASNINSALSRIASTGQDNGVQNVSSSQREAEAESLLNCIGFPAIAISALDSKIIGANAEFDSLLGSHMNLRGYSLNEIPDKSLLQNIMDIIPNLRADPTQQQVSELPFAGQPHNVIGQTIMAASEPGYFLILIKKVTTEGGY